jgi:hypothetical protein
LQLFATLLSFRNKEHRGKCRQGTETASARSKSESTIIIIIIIIITTSEEQVFQQDTQDVVI